MPDGIVLDVGTISTDELANGKHVQHVKIMDGADDGTLKAAVTSEGLAVKVNAVAADPFGTNADAAIAAGAAGSISAKLRSISRDTAAGIVLAAGANRIGKVTLRNAADSADINPVSETTIGEVTASPTANTVLDRLKQLLTGVVLAPGANRIGTVTIRDATNAVNIDPLSDWNFTSRVGELTASPAANTLLARVKDLLTGIILAGSTNHIGQVGGESDVIAVTPTVSATPDYSIGDVVGGKQTLTNAVRVSTGKAVWTSLTIIDRANVKPQMELLLFNSDPVGAGAAYNDNAALAYGTGDLDQLIHRETIATADWVTVGGVAIVSRGNIRKICRGVGSANLFAVAVATATVNLGATNDLTFRYGFKQD